MDERRPDETQRVPVHGHEVVTYSFGHGEEALLLVNGGPGLGCDCVRDSHRTSPSTGIALSPMINSAAVLRIGRTTSVFGPSRRNVSMTLIHRTSEFRLASVTAATGFGLSELADTEAFALTA
jgi:hypothetical protein